MVAAAKLLQLCPTLCNPIDGSPPGSPFPGILRARTLEWVAISFSNAWKWKVKVKSLSRIWLLATPWTAAYQAPHPWDFLGKSTGVGDQCHLCRMDYHSLIYIPWKTSLGNSYFPMIPWTIQEATSPYHRFTKYLNCENCYIKEICQISFYLAFPKIIWPEELSILLLKNSNY